MLRIMSVYDYSLLRKKIQESGYSQEALAPLVNMGRTSLNLKLNNRAAFSQREILRIAQLLNIPNNELGRYFFTLVVQKNVQKETKEEVK